jgi:phage internal scaffolding protein
MSKKDIMCDVVGHLWSIEERRKRGALFFDQDPGLTEQSHSSACDINKIMANYEKTGLVPVPQSRVPKYGDFSQVNDYQTALNLVMEAEDAFMSLPANVRSEFDHDPAKFLAAVEDPQERAKLVDRGVLTLKEGESQGVTPIQPVKASDSSDGEKKL